MPGTRTRAPGHQCPHSLLRRTGTAVVTPSHVKRRLLADAEFPDNRFVTLGIVFLKVVEQTTPFADQHEKPAPGGVVFLVRLEMIRQLTNTFAQNRDLDFRAPGVGLVGTVLVD